jgi:hypothetical protein
MKGGVGRELIGAKCVLQIFNIFSNMSQAKHVFAILAIQ